MSKAHSRLAAALAAALAAGLVGFSLRPSSAAPVASRNPAVEVRTQVIRRTIHIVRHERPRAFGSNARTYVASAQGARGVQGARAGGTAPGVSTRTSIHSAPTAAAGVAPTAGVTTRTSVHATAPASGAPTSTSPAGTPVTTRTSKHHTATGTGGSTGSSHPVTTRTSKRSGSGGSSGSGPVTTRTSNGGDGGDGGGHDN
jgi:hypothetical protein